MPHQGIEPAPAACRSDALPTELQPDLSWQIFGFYFPYADVPCRPGLKSGAARCARPAPYRYTRTAMPASLCQYRPAPYRYACTAMPVPPCPVPLCPYRSTPCVPLCCVFRSECEICISESLKEYTTRGHKSSRRRCFPGRLAVPQAHCAPYRYAPSRNTLYLCAPNCNTPYRCAL